MTIHPIRTARDHKKALARVERLWGAAHGTPAGDELDVLVTLVDAYETTHHPIPPPHPVEAILFRMEQMGLTRADLAVILGSRSRVTEVLSGKRPLSLRMLKTVRREMGVPA